MVLRKKISLTLSQIDKKFIFTTVRRWTNHEAIDEAFHFLPMGKGDVGQQTRVSFLSKDMTEDPNKVKSFIILFFCQSTLLYIGNILGKICVTQKI